MLEQQLWTALRAAAQRRHGRSSAREWPLVSEALQKVDTALGERTVRDVRALIGLAQDVSLDIETRATVCWVLGRAGVRAAVETLIAVASDDAADLRIAAINALGELGGRRAFRVLSRAARTDPDAKVRYAAVYSLQNFDTDRCAQVLLSVFNDHGELPSIRGQAAESLATLSRAGKRAVPALRAALAEPSAEVRFWSVYALGFLGTADVFKDLNQLIDDAAVVEPFGSVGEEARQAIATIRELTQGRIAGG